MVSSDNSSHAFEKIRRHKQNRWGEATRKRQRNMADVIAEVEDLGQSLFLGLKFVIFVGLFWRQSSSSHTANTEKGFKKKESHNSRYYNKLF